MRMLRLYYFILSFTNTLRCYGEDVISQVVDEEATEDKRIIEDDNLNNTDIWDTEVSSVGEDDIEKKMVGDGDMEETKMKGKVVGGVYASITNYPHSVFLTINCGSIFYCGSSVLNQRILLTAAHCVVNCKTAKKFKIDAVAGSTNILQSTVLRQIKRFIMHDDYDDDTVYCDIALLQLNGNLPFGKTIQRVIIRPTFPNNAEGMVAGWGLTSENFQKTMKLKRVKQRVWKMLKCNQFENMLKGTICGSSGSIYNYPFLGDSGSALITKNFQEIGLVSYKREKVDLIVYTNVSYFYPWIVENSKKLRCYIKETN